MHSDLPRIAGANCPASFFQVARSWSRSRAFFEPSGVKVCVYPSRMRAEPSRAFFEPSGVLLALACWRLSGCAVFVCVSRKFRLAFRRPKCESVAGRIADSTYARLSLSAVFIVLRALHSLRLAYCFTMPGDWLPHTASLGHPLNTPATFSFRPRISATARANPSQSLQRASRRSADFSRRAAEACAPGRLKQRGRSTGQRKAGAGCFRLCATFPLLSAPSPHKPRSIQSGARLARFFFGLEKNLYTKNW